MRMELSKEAREAQRRYLKEWRNKNPERVRETKRRYWEKRAAQLAANQNGGDDGDGPASEHVDGT